MAARGKSFASVLLFFGLLSSVTVSTWGEDVEVLFVVPQQLESEGVLKIIGNTSVLGDSIPRSAPDMTPIGDDFWVLNVTLSGGVTYELNVLVLPRGFFFPCYCRPVQPHVFTVPSEAEYYVEELDGYECNNVPCPRLRESNMFNAIRGVV